MLAPPWIRPWLWGPLSWADGPRTLQPSSSLLGHMSPCFCNNTECIIGEGATVLLLSWCSPLWMVILSLAWDAFALWQLNFLIFHPKKKISQLLDAYWSFGEMVVVCFPNWLSVAFFVFIFVFLCVVGFSFHRTDTSLWHPFVFLLLGVCH